MIDGKEMMYGFWIQDKDGKPSLVKAITPNRNARNRRGELLINLRPEEEWYPIPLTEDLLDQFGYPRSETEQAIIYNVQDDMASEVELHIIKETTPGFDIGNFVLAGYMFNPTVHDFQFAYLSVVRVPLTLKL